MDEEAYSLFVTSSIRGEGKTTVVANLGWELAALDKRVLLIDFDLGQPALGSYFMDSIDYNHTVNAVYFDDVSVQEAIVHITPQLHLLPARLDSRQIGINRFAKKLVANMESRYDIVLIDTPPVGESSQTLYLSNVSSNCLYVIRYDYAGCDAIEESLEKLQKTSITVHGAVVSRVPQLSSLLNERSGGASEKTEGKKLRSLLKPRVKKKVIPAEDDEDGDDDLEDDEDEAPVETVQEKVKEAPTGKRKARTAAIRDEDELEHPKAAAAGEKKNRKAETPVRRKKTEKAEPEPEKPERKKPERTGPEPTEPEENKPRVTRKPPKDGDLWLSLGAR